MARINYSEKKWLLHDLKPHVAMRIKRFMPKVNVHNHNTIILSATPEVSRDLELFLSDSRFQMEIEPGDREILTQLSQKHRDTEKIVEDLMRGKFVEGPPRLMKLPPRDYQILAAELWRAVRGYLLADEVGLGKTVSAVAGMVEPGRLPALVVTLTHLPFQWEEEISKFTDFKVHILKKATPYDVTKFCGGKFPDVLVSNYHKLSGWARTLTDIGIKSVVFDEAHELRHASSGKYYAAKSIASAAEYILGLSATPIFNYGGEIFNILNIIKPDCLGTWEEFVREWCTYENGKCLIKDPTGFGIYMRDSGLCLRRTRKEVKRELLPVTIIPHTIEADTETFMSNVDTGVAIELAKRVLARGEDFKGQKMTAAGQFDLRMRQATGIAKAPAVAEFVKYLHEESQEKILLYGWHHAVFDIWKEKFTAAKIKFVCYTGRETPKQKEEAKQAFINGDAQIMIISLRAGAGTNGLQDVCKIVVYGELDYSPSVHIQDTGRLHRDGQDETVISYYLMAETGSDPVISDILGVKRQQLNGISDPDQEMVQQPKMDPDYIKKLARDFLTKQGVKFTEEPGEDPKVWEIENGETSLQIS